MMMQQLKGQPKLVEDEELRLDPHAVTEHWTS
jgi:hypothetical protein